MTTACVWLCFRSTREPQSRRRDDDRSTLDDLVSRMLSAFQRSDVATPPGTIIGIEEELTGELVPGVPDLLARVDLLVDAGDHILITDANRPGNYCSTRSLRSRPIRLQFAVATKLKNPDVHLYQVDAYPQQIDRVKRIVERVWEGIERQIFYPSPSAMDCARCPYRDQCRNWAG